MPELGPYGSMREEARKSLPYRDPQTLPLITILLFAFGKPG